jgi:hypothetical protein
VNLLPILRLYLRLAMPLRKLVRLPFHADTEICKNEECPLCYRQLAPEPW